MKQWLVSRFLRYLSVLSVLNTSSLLCDCYMQWLGPWLTDSQFQQSVSAVCAHPAGLLGRSVLSISPEEFVCGQSHSLFPIWKMSVCVIWQWYWVLVLGSLQFKYSGLLKFHKQKHLQLFEKYCSVLIGRSVTTMLLFLYWHSFTLSAPAPPQTISPSLISQLTRRRLWHCGGSTWLWAALPPAAAIRQWPQLGGRMGRCCMTQKCKTTPGIRRESWSTPLCFISSMSTSLMRGVTSVWSQITLAPTTPTGPSLLSMVRMFALR